MASSLNLPSNWFHFDNVKHLAKFDAIQLPQPFCHFKAAKNQLDFQYFYYCGRLRLGEEEKFHTYALRSLMPSCQRTHPVLTFCHGKKISRILFEQTLHNFTIVI